MNASTGRRLRAALVLALAVALTAIGAPGAQADDPLDPARNVPLACEFVGAPQLVPRSAKNIAHLANVCGLVGTDVEFQSRTDARGKVRDFAFVGTMGAGTRIFDVTDPSHPFQVGGYADPGWQNDVQVRGNTLVLAFDPLVVSVNVSTCLRQKSPTTSITRGGVDIVRLSYDPLLNRFTTSLAGCYLNAVSGGAHNASLHPSGDWLAIDTSSSGIEVVDLRGGRIAFVGKIESATGGTAHDVSFSADGDTMYVGSPSGSGGVGGAFIVDVSNVLEQLPAQQPPRIGFISENAQGAPGSRYNLVTTHQADSSSDGRILVFTDERGGGLSQTQCNTNPEGIIGGAHFYALAPIEGRPETEGASPAAPVRLGTWFYPNPLLAVDQLDPILAEHGRTERACTIHVLRNGGNGTHGPGEIAPGFDGVSRLPATQLVSAHYGAGVWWLDFSGPASSADGIAEDQFSDWANTRGWNVMPGADTWSAKEYKGYIYAGDMVRGFDVYSFAPCEGIGCVVVPTNVPGRASGGGNAAALTAELDIVEGSSVGGRATFGFDVAYRIGQIVPEGTLSFRDHTLGKRVEATAITSFQVLDGKATFGGIATVDGVRGVRFEVVVQDNGEPGRNDSFLLFTADGYLASGTLKGGNIEVESDPNSILSTG
jgi:hypothetical protein